MTKIPANTTPFAVEVTSVLRGAQTFAGGDAR